MSFRPSPTGVVLAAAFAAAVVMVDAQHFEGSWSGMVVFVLGLPLTVVGLLFGALIESTGIWPVVLCGAAQYYLIGAFLEARLAPRR